MKVTRDAVVVLHYRLFDAQGTLVESSDEAGPIRYRHGRAELLPGLESALEEAAEGDSLRLSLEPDEAFGRYDPGGIVAVPRTELSDEVDYRPGDWVSLRVEGGEAQGEEAEMEMRVLEVHPEQVLMDANHPLAGQRVTFELEVVSVESPER